MEYKALALAIIIKAIDDYREAKEWNRPTDEIEEFFESEWCTNLLQNLALTGKDILEYLRNE